MWEEFKDTLEKFDIEKIKEIIKKYPERINEEISEGYNALQYICNRSNSFCKNWDSINEIIIFLLESGININERHRRFGYTALIILCINFCEFDKNRPANYGEKIVLIIELLLNSGADPNLRSDPFPVALGGTCLHYLLNHLCYSLSNSARIFDIDPEQYKSLIKIVKLLIEKGIDINLRDGSGQLAIEEFLLYNSKFKNDKKTIEEIIKIMLENGLDVEKIEFRFPFLKFLFTYQLEKENEELRYCPGNPGYHRTMEDFDKLAGVKKK